MRSLITLLIFSSVLALAGCGYSHGSGYQWKSLYREDVQTVAVPVFKNVTYYRGVEIALSKAIVNDIEAHTPYKVTDSRKADTILEGEIVRVRAHTLSSDSRAAIPQEQLYIITCNFVWKDLRTGRILVDRRNFEQMTTFYPTLGESQWVGEQSGVEQLAMGIVQELQADW